MRITCCVSLLLVAVFAAGCEQLQKKPQEKPALNIGYSGKAVAGLLSHDFVFKIWHYYPGTVHNGVVQVQATGTYVNGGKPVSETFSFDAWPPNEENARTFKFKVDRPGADLQIRFDIEVRTEETGERNPFAIFWADSGWDEEAGKAEIRKGLKALQQQLEGASSATQ